MAFADDLRKQTVTDQQRRMKWRNDVLSDREKYVGSFRYACEQAAKSGKRTCTLIFQNNYDDNICNFYTDDYGTAKEVRVYVEQALQQDGFKTLKVCVEKFKSNRSVERTMLKSLLGRYKYEKFVYYTLRIEAKW